MRSLRALAFAVIVLLCVARVTSTYRVFSQTVDEPIHIAAGLQWLTNGRVDIDPGHPPLARIAFGIGPYLEGARVIEGQGDVKGNEVLDRGDRYRHNLSLVRIGNLPFFLLGLAVVSLWSWRLFGAAAGIIALAMFGSLPPVLGHAGLATTDMAACATTAAALLALTIWLETPTLRNALILGIAIGIGLLAKYSFVVFFPIGAIVFLLALRRRTRPAQAGVAIAVAFLVMWAGFRFQIGTLNSLWVEIFPDASTQNVAAKYARVHGYEWVRADLIERYWLYSNAVSKEGFHGVDFVDWAKAAGYPSPLAGRHGNTMAGEPAVPRPNLAARLSEPLRRAEQWTSLHVPLPAPAFIGGAAIVARHSQFGHRSFLLGHYSDTGWWYYFPVILFFKTPLPLIVLSVAGTVMLVFKHQGEALAVAICPFAMLLPALLSKLNIGVRHVLPLYPFLAIAAAYAVVALWRWSRGWRITVCALLAWFFVGTAVAHPDYLAYFNECALGHPERIVCDSNLDWGQDLLRLGDAVRRLHIQHLYIFYFGSADSTRHLQCRVDELPGFERVSGWVAVSEQSLIMGVPDKRDVRWLQAYQPVREIGKSIRLYNIPPLDRPRTRP